jgi:hypothetical protein
MHCYTILFISHLLCLAWTFAPAPATAQVIQWLSPLAHDFGQIRARQPVTCEFIYRNTSPRPLTIDNVRTTCGCTAPDWSAQPIASGAADTIRIEFDAYRPGYFNKKIKVYWSGIRQPALLTITGEVVE